MKGKLLLLVAFLYSFSSFCQQNENCKSKISKMEDLNIINYNKCLIKNSSVSKKNKLQIANRIQNQLFLKISSKNTKNKRNLRFSTKRKRKVESFINSAQLTKDVKSTYIPNEILFALVDELPQFDICNNNNSVQCFNTGLREHFVSNFTYPKQAVKDKLEGRVFVRFVINKQGEIDNIQTFSSGNKTILEDEVRRIVLTFPKFKAGKELGQNIDVVYSMPIDFKL